MLLAPSQHTLRPVYTFAYFTVRRVENDTSEIQRDGRNFSRGYANLR